MYEIKLIVDRGTTDVVRLFMTEDADPNVEGWTEYATQYLEPGVQEIDFTYVVTETGSLSLQLDKTDASTLLDTETTFKILYAKIEKVNFEILEENNYYAFGMKHEGYNTVTTATDPALKYKYNGKELQDELDLNWYDYQARNYDPSLGRWFNIDPLAETSRRYSPYTYCLDNPIYFIDPDGMEADDFTILIAKEGASGYGHMAAVIQDGDGNYYYVTMGATENAGFSKMSGEGVQGGMLVQKLEGAKTMEEAVSIAKTDSSNSPYTDQVTFETNSKTDQNIFESTMEKANNVNSGEDKYNVVSNNCTDAVERPIEDATGVSLPDETKPNSNFKALKDNQKTIQKNITSNENKINNVKVKSEKPIAKTAKDNTNVNIESNPELDLN